MSESRTRVDEAIDRAVRELMRRDTPAGFRARVLARLDAPPRRMAMWPALATAAGVLAVAAIGLVVLREPVTDAPSHPVPVAASGPAPAGPATDAPRRPETAPPAADSPVRRAPRAEPVRTATFGPRDGRVAAASLAVPRPEPADAGPAPAAIVESVAETAGPSPIAVRPLASPNPIEIAPITVPPLQIPRMPQGPASPPR
jgi:hypothetical protein